MRCHVRVARGPNLVLFYRLDGRMRGSPGLQIGPICFDALPHQTNRILLATYRPIYEPPVNIINVHTTSSMFPRLKTWSPALPVGNACHSFNFSGVARGPTIHAGRYSALTCDMFF